jgi:hypothetical protein
VSRTNRDGGSSSLEKERQNPNTRPTAFGTKVCGISISVLGTQLDIDKDGNICAMTIEHARDRADIPNFSFKQIAA